MGEREVYRLRRIPRSRVTLSFFLSRPANREGTKTILHLYIACLSLSLPPFSAKTLLAYITRLTSWLGPRPREPVFAMREAALAKNKSASDSLSFVAPFDSRDFLFSSYVSGPSGSSGCTRTRSRALPSNIERSIASPIESPAIRRSTITTSTTCHRDLSNVQDGAQGIILPERLEVFLILVVPSATRRFTAGGTLLSQHPRRTSRNAGRH